MTGWDEKVKQEPPFGYPSDTVARGRWLNPALGVLDAVFLGRYLTGYRSVSIASDESTFGSIPDLLKAAFAAAIAFSWAAGGTWFGMRRARVAAPLDAATYYTRANGCRAHTGLFATASDLRANVR
jgi:hypothetical protein